MARALDLHSRGQGFDSLILHARLKKVGEFIKTDGQEIKLVHKLRFDSLFIYTSYKSLLNF